MTTTAQHTDFEGFYQAHYRDTVAMIYTFTADLPAAQDIAQEAFTRAWQRWHQVSVYENPVAWIRRVAFNLAHTRWRRLKVATAYLLKQRVEDEPAVSPNHVAVVAALRKLPQRHARRSYCTTSPTSRWKQSRTSLRRRSARSSRGCIAAGRRWRTIS